jgi:hypothetical protein
MNHGLILPEKKLAQVKTPLRQFPWSKPGYFSAMRCESG